jgi:TonB family protein
MESYPKYPDGIEGFFSDLKNNIEIPKKAVKKDMHRSVTVGFVVQTDGSISEISIIESDDKIFNQSAINAIEGLKKWKPGIQKGNPIKVAYQQKINF